MSAQAQWDSVLMSRGAIMEASQQPLVLCTENAAGEEVSLSIEPTDDFHSFLIKANSILGYEVDLNSVTRNQPVALTDNIYQFFMNSENNRLDLDYPIGSQTLDQMLDPNAEGADDLVYVLDDGTQIKASQIHFDNEDPPFDFIAEKIPFVKYIDDGDDDVEAPSDVSTRMINIVASPVAKWSSDTSPNKPFINCVPFKPVNNHSSGFAAQFTKYLEANVDKTFTPLNPVATNNKSPRSLISDNYKKYDENIFNKNDYITRDEVLNLFKDPPAVPYESNHSFSEKRRHVRKSDPSRPFPKATSVKPMPYIDDDGTLIGQNESQNCFICEKFVDNNVERLYLFDNEDQKLHRSSPQKKLSTQLKIICEQCLDNNFKPSRMKSPSQNLDPDEYLVIRNNQQYIFQKTNSIDFKNIRGGFVNVGEAAAIIDKIESEILKGNQVKHMDFVKVEIGSDGEIKTKDDIVKDKAGGSSDVEIVDEPEIDYVIDNLEEADEEVKEFLGMYQCDNNLGISELKCRFCELVFADLPELMEHGGVHKHAMEDGDVFPCPLCNYGYANLKWLKGHLKAAHDRSLKNKTECKSDDVKNEPETQSTTLSPVAKRTRSNDKMKDEKEGDLQESGSKPLEESNLAKIDGESTLEFKLEVKQEALDTSDEEAIWIVHTADDEAADQLHTLLHGSEKTDEAVFKRPQKCVNCSQIMVDESTHKCRKRGRKRKSLNKDENATFLQKIQRPRKKRTTELTSDPQIVTCHNCNESYTSKVRLKFHMQFHDNTEMLNASGQYSCLECSGTTFATETELFDHVHFQHDKQNRYQCPVKECGKTFFLRASLTKHSRTHTDTRRYVCGTCGKRFLDKQTLDEHGVTHLQIKPFQCHICLKQLTRRSRLRMHMRAHEEALCPALVPVCAACRRAFQDVPTAVEHVKKSTECLQAFANDLKANDKPSAMLSPTSGLVRSTQEAETGLSELISREARCAGAGALLSALPPALRRCVRCVRVEKAFRCEYCEDVFYLEEDLNNHRRIHKGIKNPFTCHICKVSFATYSRCTTHKTTHGFYKRPLAEAKSQPGDGAPSARILGYGGFPVVKHFLCEDCGRSYLHWTYLQVHRRMKHANENFIYQCNQCSETFPNSWSVAYHRKKVHGKAGLTNGVTKTVTNDYRIPCRDCDEVLPNKTALYKHRKKEHSYVTLPVEDKQSTVQAHTCHVCNSVFASRTELDTHTLTHTSRAACAHCGQSFSHQQLLYNHLKDIHGQDLQYNCNECSSRFSSPVELAQHSRSHSQRPHTCGVCGRVFRTASVLAEHTRIHTGERPFPCDVCGVAFRRATAMRNHRLIHTGVRAWGCARCPKRFRIRSDLNTHARLKHPLHYAVLEVQGLNPSPDQVLRSLTTNNIARENVIEITKISFPKGTTSIVPDSYRALSMLSGVRRTEVAWDFSPPTRSNFEDVEEVGTGVRRGRGIARLPLSRGPTVVAQSEDLTGLNVQMLLQNNTLDERLLEDSLGTRTPLDTMLLLNPQPQQ